MGGEYKHTCDDRLLDVLHEEGVGLAHRQAEGQHHLVRLLFRCKIEGSRSPRTSLACISTDYVSLTMRPTGLGPTRMMAVQSCVMKRMKAAQKQGEPGELPQDGCVSA
jgi:hypothetical protein